MEYTLAEAAKLAKVNRSTLFRSIKKGNLSARKLEDGTFRVDASELARVYDLQHVARNSLDALHHGAQGEVDATTRAPDRDSGGEAALLRLKVQMLEDQLARERTLREEELERIAQEREDARSTVQDLRKRLDKAEERILALVAPERAEDRPNGSPPRVVEPVKAPRGFMARLLGR
jgi:hypothetical protein